MCHVLLPFPNEGGVDWGCEQKGIERLVGKEGGEINKLETGCKINKQTNTKFFNLKNKKGK